jgi:RNA 2',3'-cyclic 3'-phosphodiesterase
MFLALDLTERARDSLAAWRDAAVGGRDDLRPVRAESLHVTLVFLGWQAEKDAERIASEAFGAIQGLDVPVLTAAGVKAVPPRGTRLFALDLDDAEGRATSLQRAAGESLAAARLWRPEKRPWWPHLTLARVKRGRRAAPLEAPPPPAEPFEAPRATLYRSVLQPQGARYEVITSVDLPGAR